MLHEHKQEPCNRIMPPMVGMMQDIGDLANSLDAQANPPAQKPLVTAHK